MAKKIHKPESESHTVIHISVDKDTHDTLKQKAVDDDRSLNSYCRTVLKSHLQEAPNA